MREIVKKLDTEKTTPSFSKVALFLPYLGKKQVQSENILN